MEFRILKTEIFKKIILLKIVKTQELVHPNNSCSDELQIAGFKPYFFLQFSVEFYSFGFEIFYRKELQILQNCRF